MGTLKHHSQNTLKAKSIFFIGIIVGIVIFGVSGYMLIEGWSFVDSLYMTTITIATVGYSEVNGLSVEGKIFTIFLIIISFGNFALAIGSLTRYIVEGEYKRDIREIKVKRNLKNMKGHVIVTGFGRVGRQVTDDLLGLQREVVVIEQTQALVESYVSKGKIQFIHGNATTDEALKTAGIDKASAIVTCLPNDSDNLYIVLGAKEFNSQIQIIARASSSEAVAKLYMAGATNVVMPDSIGGSHMASLIANPDVANFLDLISISGESEVNIECIHFHDLPEQYQNKRIGALEVRSHTGANIIGFQTVDGKIMINPDSSIEIIRGSRLFVLGTKEQIQLLNNYLKS